MEEFNTIERKNDKIDLFALWHKMRKKWYLFAGAIFLFVSVAIVYLVLARPVYRVSADI